MSSQTSTEKLPPGPGHYKLKFLDKVKGGYMGKK